MTQKQSFGSLGIAGWLAEKLQSSNITVPTKVQEEAIPIVLEGRDIIAQSPTGTGKTFAYLLPILTKLNLETKGIQAIILAPTRELAMQITRTANELGAEQGILTMPVLGGVNIRRQIDNLKKKPHLLAGTPGRVLELLQMRKINAQTIRSVVIDEVDKMWQLGFKDDVQAIIKATLRDRQVIMVSATVSPEMVASSLQFLKDPELVNLSIDSQVAEGIKHIYFMSQEKNKAETLQKLIGIYKPRAAIAFINSNKGVLPFVKRFRSFGIAAEGLHSELNPLERKTALEKLRAGKVQLLVTTDLFARGMDIKDIEIIFNFDLPPNPEYYIHRVGRTGRAGKSGLAVNFVTPEQKFIISKYEKELGIRFEEWGVSGEKVIPVRKREPKNAVINKGLPGKKM